LEVVTDCVEVVADDFKVAPNISEIGPAESTNSTTKKSRSMIKNAV